MLTICVLVASAIGVWATTTTRLDAHLCDHGIHHHLDELDDRFCTDEEHVAFETTLTTIDTKLDGVALKLEHLCGAMGVE